MIKDRQFIYGLQMKGLFTLFLLSTLISCDRSFNVKFVVPVGFHGLVRIHVSPKGQSVRKINGAYTFIIPADGYLEVHSRYPLGEWHRTKAFWSDGKPLPVDVRAGVAFHNLLTDSEGNDYFYIGTQEEAEKARKDADENSELGQVLYP